MTSLLKYISPEYRMAKEARRNARAALLKLREAEAIEALGGPKVGTEPVKPKPPKIRSIVGHKKTGNVELIDQFIGNVGEPPLSTRFEERGRKKRKVLLFKGSAGVPVLRRFTRGKSKYYPNQEDRKHAEEAAGGRLQRAGRVARRLRDRVLGGTTETVRPGLPGAV